MRILGYILSAAIIAAVVAGAFYSTQAFWLSPFINTTTKQIDPKSLGPLIIVLPAAVSAVVVGLLSGVASLLAQKEQRAAALAVQSEQRAAALAVQNRQAAANDALETKKGEIIEALDKKRGDLTLDLEATKSRYMRELEDHKDQIAIRRAALDEALDRMKEARDTAAQYRFAVGNLRHGSLFRCRGSTAQTEA